MKNVETELWFEFKSHNQSGLLQKRPERQSGNHCGFIGLKYTEAIETAFVPSGGDLRSLGGMSVLHIAIRNFLENRLVRGEREEVSTIIFLVLVCASETCSEDIFKLGSFREFHQYNKYPPSQGDCEG